MTESTPKRYKIWEPVLLSIVAVIGMIAGARMAGSSADRTSAGVTRLDYSGRQVEEIIRFLESRYVDEVSSDELVARAIHAILEGLDPHTHYFPPDQRDELDEKTAGQYGGIGVEIAFIRDSLYVLYPREDSPAEKAGLKPGDIVIAVDGRSIYADSLDQDSIISLIRGPKGTKINLTLRPMLRDTQYQVELTRDEIKVPSVVAGLMTDTAVAYIKINRFSQDTYREFMDHWERLYTEDGARHLILDVRDNPGGFLNEAVNILSQIIAESGKTLVYTMGKDGVKHEYKSTGKIFFPIDHVVVLIDENSASASEIIAGCIQDLDRGVVVGMPSFGKGLVQEQFDLANGGTLRMTVSRYYTPAGRLIQKAYDSLSVVDTVSAFLTARGREMKAGGGITPDVVVKPEIDWHDPAMKYWMDIVSEYALRQILSSGETTRASKSDVPVLRKQIPPRTEILASIKALANRHKVPGMDTLVRFADAHAGQLADITQATIIAYRTGEAGWHAAYLEHDPVIRKARQLVMQDPLTALHLAH
jgi:carboxyl-terminal processing protease